MRILLISQWFDPEPTFKGLLFAKQLQSMGHQVQVITGFPNYPGGKVYPGYRIRLFQREMMDGVEVLRVLLYPSHDQSAQKRLLNYLSFMLSATVIGLSKARKADVIYAYHPPLTTGIAAAIIGKLCGIPMVCDIQDLWPDTLAATGMMDNKRVLSAVQRACGWVYGQASHLTVLSPGFKTRLEQRGVPEAKISVIPNWADEAQLKLDKRPFDGAEWGLEHRFNVIFAGTMGKAQKLESVLEAAQQLESSHPEIQFVFVGGGIEVPRLQELARGRSNVLFLPRMTVAEVGRVLAWADALLVHLKDDSLFEITIPSKTQAYMAVGKPILMAVKGDAADLVRSADAGVIALPENAASLVESVLELYHLNPEVLAQKGRNGHDYYFKQLSLAIGSARFTEVFEGLRLQRRPSPGKRATDLILSSLGLVVLALPMAAIALLVRLKMGSPVLFKQQRPGLQGKPFDMYKFRTMLEAHDFKGNPLSDAERLTPLGRFLRSSSLDELPELYNVLRGEMSLVGPRPLLMEYLERYTPEQARRHQVRPGITGWAQVNGRNAIGWEKKFELDVWYVDNRTFRLDLKILWLTVLKVLKREGISAIGEATMSEFMGSAQPRRRPENQRELAAFSQER